jgi:hypothetical protein
MMAAVAFAAASFIGVAMAGRNSANGMGQKHFRWLHWIRAESFAGQWRGDLGPRLGFSAATDDDRSERRRAAPPSRPPHCLDRNV